LAGIALQFRYKQGSCEERVWNIKIDDVKELTSLQLRKHLNGEVPANVLGRQKDTYECI
jgi:hypothetical protein